MYSSNIKFISHLQFFKGRTKLKLPVNDVIFHVHVLLQFPLDTLVLMHIYSYIRILCLFNVISFSLVGAKCMDSKTDSSVGLTTQEALSRLRQDIETVVNEYEEFQIKRYYYMRH
jgi:hypothetical protein